LAYSPTMKMDVIHSSEMSGSLWTTKCYNPEDSVLHSHCHENLKSNKSSKNPPLRLFREK
jgi:hypothetical protein